MGGKGSGRKKQPAVILDAKGSFAKDPQKRRKDPIAPKGKPLPPAYLGRIAKSKFRELCDHADSLGVLSLVDGGLLEIAAASYERYRTLSKWLDKHGHATVTGSRRPESYRLREAEDRYCRCLSAFGLDPTSRIGLHVPADAGDSKLAQFLKHRNAS